MNDCSEMKISLYNLYFLKGVQRFWEVFNIEYSSSELKDIVKKFKEYLSKNIPIKSNNNIT